MSQRVINSHDYSSELPARSGPRTTPIRPFIERRLFLAPNMSGARCEMTSFRLTGLEIQKSGLTSTIWSRELGLVSLRLKMAITTYATYNAYAVLGMLQRRSGWMTLARLYLSNKLTTAVPSKGRDLLRFQVSEPSCISRKGHIQRPVYSGMGKMVDLSGRSEPRR